MAQSVTVALATDSSAQLPALLVERYGIHVIPIGIVIDGVPYREGKDLDVDEFYARLRNGAKVSTATPPPGDFVEAYEAIADAAAA
jgi:fatty acid-binding protein DegV